MNIHSIYLFSLVLKQQLAPHIAGKYKGNKQEKATF